MSEVTAAGFFTHGVSPESYRLPHPRIPIPVILLIQRVLCRAFERLRARKNWLASATEDEVTAALLGIIENDFRQTGSIPGFNRQSFESVVRQAQVANFDGTRLAKTPDLRFKLKYDEREPRTVLSEFEALFVECKPVDAAHPVGAKYCDDGLIRFVAGHYAWAMNEGMMLAYARNGRNIAKHLLPAMKETARISSLATVQFPQPFPMTNSSIHDEVIHVSKHRRNFVWQDGKGKATNITIYHLWHDCN